MLTSDHRPGHEIAGSQPALLVVDAPNVDAVHGGLLGRRPRRSERFNAAALSTWVSSITGSSLERTIFTNVPSPIPPGVEGWIKSMVEEGWRIYAKPKRRPTDDIDDEMLAHIQGGSWTSVVVFSHDSACFANPMVELQLSGTPVTVVGFRECAGRLPHLDRVEYVDVDDVPGLYREPPPRVRVDRLPASGGWIDREVS